MTEAKTRSLAALPRCRPEEGSFDCVAARSAGAGRKTAGGHSAQDDGRGVGGRHHAKELRRV